MDPSRERLVHVDNETTASTSRISRDGRRITYKLKVLQQPERARACGSGAKSSADRRPVDPPPIVELRIYEGENEEKDVTFQLSANYFLFATLEQARPMAQGRVQQDPSRATVLTGTPVAGMVYLDRPLPAGYFIFPDLSVRHEGKYRLGFSLYEELKDMKDGDRTDENGANAQGLGEAQVTHRLEVRSVPFIVYSAKKFPGLASSTTLSRTVAEQGCRVRIRRDVRMRRRDKPEKGGYDGYSDARSATPDMYHQHLQESHAITERERSASLASHHSLVGVPDSRRASMQDPPPGYSQAPYGHAPPASQPLQTAPTAQPQYIGPVAQQYGPQYSYQQTQMQPPPMPYQGYSYAPPSGPVGQPNPYPYPQVGHAVPVGHYESQPQARNLSMDYGTANGQDSRRSSTLNPPPSYAYGPPQTVHAQYAQHSCGYPLPATTREGHAAPNGTKTSMHSASSMGSQILPPINTSSQPREKLEPSTPTSAVSTAHAYYGNVMSHQQAQQQGPAAEAHAGSKRHYDRVFSTEHLNAPLRQGARPSSPYVHTNGQSIEHGQDDSMQKKMLYRRADGREILRSLPPSI